MARANPPHNFNSATKMLQACDNCVTKNLRAKSAAAKKLKLLAGGNFEDRQGLNYFMLNRLRVRT
jgi:hypothetical protein